MTSSQLQLTKLLADQVNSEVSEKFQLTLGDLKALVKIPGIAWEAFDPKDLDRSAIKVKELFESEEIFDSVQILRSKYDSSKVGAPAVVAVKKARNNRPTILLYAHHDVQPPGDETLWESAPFEPEERGGRLFGRGAADDKAGIMAHLAAIRALRALAGHELDLGLVIFIEGEEEAGSPSFGSFLKEYRDLLEADVIVVADSSNWTREIPAITTTLRGLVSLEFEVRTLRHAVHSGMYGGAAPDAMLALVRILGSMWDESGNVSILGLKTAENSNLDYPEAIFREDSGLLPSTKILGDGSILSQMWSKPALSLIGLDFPSVALSSNTLIPSLRVKLSLRLAPGDNPEAALEALKSHILKNNPLGAEINFGEVELGKPFELAGSDWAKPLAEQALELAYGHKPVDIGIGGSIPFIADLEEVFPGAQILVTGVEDPDSRAHSPNESVEIEGLKKAIIAETLFLLSGNRLSLDRVDLS